MPNEDRVADILREWLERRNRGEEVKPEELLRDHPDLADELLPRLQALDALDQALPKPARLPEGSPKTIGEYRIIREIGRGGMGVIYEAVQPSMSRKVALKLLAPVFTESTQAIKRFHREAKAAGTLHHTNIVQAYTMGEHEGYWYYTMELVEGGSLAQMIERFRSEKPNGNNRRSHYVKVARMFSGVADALDAAHKAGIIHRDIKPGNLMLDTDGNTLKIVDFGMARLDESPSLTMSGDVLGTPIYMSPEQAQAKLRDIDHRTDIYSFGATLYEALTLRPPFKGKSALAIRSQIITRDPPPPRQVDRRIPRDLAVICSKAMEKDRKDRYQTAKEMARDLLLFEEGLPIRARPVGVAGRAWRKVKRNKVRTSLVATILVLAVAGAHLAVRSYQEAEERRGREYVALLNSAQDHFRKYEILLNSACPEPESYNDHFDKACEYYGKAIRKDSARPEAYWLRAMTPGRTIIEKMKDIDEAASRGLSDQTVQLLRGYVQLHEKDHWDPSVALEAAVSLPALCAIDLYFKARILLAMGEKQEALELLDEAIADPKASKIVQLVSRRHRSRLFQETDNLEGALRDLHVIETLGDNSTTTRIRIGCIWNRMGRKDEGQNIFEATLNQVRSDGTAAAWNEAREACVVCEEDDWILRVAESAPREVAESQEFLCDWAWACYRKEKLNKALELTNDILKTNPDQHQTHTLRGHIFREQEKYDEAYAAYTRAVETDSSCSTAWYNRGIVQCDFLEEYDQAINDFERAIRLKPNWSLPFESKGIALSHQGHEKEAVDAFNEAIDRDSDNAKAYFIKGVAFGNLKQFDEAIKAYSETISKDPDYVKAYYNMGVTLRRLERWDEAVEVFNEAIRRDPNCTEAYSNRGWILLHELDQPEDALKDYEQAIKNAPDCSDSFEQHGLALAALGKEDEALKSFLTAVDLDSKSASAWAFLGVSYQRLNRLEDSRDAFEVSVDLDPEDAPTWLNLGITYDRLDLPKNERKAFETAVRLKPDYFEAHYDLGNALRDMGDLKGAIEAYCMALQLKPDNAEAHCNLGGVYKRIGDVKEALAYYKRGHELGHKRENWSYPSGEWVEECERLIVLESKLDSVIKGYAEPVDGTECMEFAKVAYYKGLYDTSASFFAYGFEMDPTLFTKDDGYVAACCAAMAGCGEGKDGAKLDEGERLRWRRQAIEWLQEQLSLNIQHLDSGGDPARSEVRRNLKWWKQERDLECVREEKRLAELPTSEQEAWRALWAEVEAVLARIQEKTD